MSDFNAVRGATLTLQALLEAHITSSPDPQLAGVPIDLRTPREMREANDATGVSLWLYRVARNGDVLNDPASRPSPDQQSLPSLPIDLYYLVTPIQRDPLDEQSLLGRAIQVMSDHSHLRGGDLRGSLQGTAAELRSTMETLTLEELTRVWAALQESYQLSVTYLVHLLAVDSGHQPIRVSPVTIRESHHDEIMSAIG